MFFAIHSCSKNSSLIKKAAIGFAVDCIPVALSLLAYFGVLKLANTESKVSIGLGGLSVTFLIADSVALYYANIALKKINNGGIAKTVVVASTAPPAPPPPSATSLTPSAPILAPSSQPQVATTQCSGSQCSNKHPAVTMPANPNELPTFTAYDRENKPIVFQCEKLNDTEVIRVVTESSSQAPPYGKALFVESSGLSLNSRYSIRLDNNGRVWLHSVSGDTTILLPNGLNVYMDRESTTDGIISTNAMAGKMDISKTSFNSHY